MSDMAVEGVEGGKKEEEKMDEEDAETEKAPVEEKKPQEKIPDIIPRKPKKRGRKIINYTPGNKF